jgi:hypothetical protein
MSAHSYDDRRNGFVSSMIVPAVRKHFGSVSGIHCVRLMKSMLRRLPSNVGLSQ